MPAIDEGVVEEKIGRSLQGQESSSEPAEEEGERDQGLAVACTATRRLIRKVIHVY